MKYFKAPFRKENYVSHVERMHMDKWIEYCKLEDAAKKAFFDVGSSNGSQSTMHAFGVTRSQPLHV